MILNGNYHIPRNLDLYNSKLELDSGKVARLESLVNTRFQCIWILLVLLDLDPQIDTRFLSGFGFFGPRYFS